MVRAVTPLFYYKNINNATVELVKIFNCAGARV